MWMMGFVLLAEMEPMTGSMVETGSSVAMK